MFELWIATWCAAWSWGNCAGQGTGVFSSSEAAVDMLTTVRQRDEFWLYPMRDFKSEEWHFIVDRTPKIKIEKKP